MNRYYTTEWGEKVDVIDHIMKTLQAHPNCKIYIATDSQDSDEKREKGQRKRVVYATCIVFRYETRGAHYVYDIELIDRPKDHFLRLYKEAERTVDAASFISGEIPIAFEALEFDYANVKKTLSTPLVSAARGLAASKGFNPVFKGGQMIASKAADHICRNK